MVKLPRLLLAVAVGAAIPLTIACAGDSPVEPRRPLVGVCGGDKIPGEYIVKLHDGVDLLAEPDSLAARHGFTVADRYNALQMFYAKHVADSAAIANEPTVSFLSPNQTACLA